MMWAIATSLDAVIRVVIDCTMPVESVSALRAGLIFATMAMMQVVTNACYLNIGHWQRLRNQPGREIREVV